MMHVAHCARNMAVCPVCGDAVPKAHLKEHRQKQHSLGKYEGNFFHPRTI